MASGYPSHRFPNMNGCVFNSYVIAYTVVMERSNSIPQGSWMIQKFWAPSMAFVKISIVIFIKRLFGSIRAYVIITNCLVAFIATWALAALLTNTFQCTPVQYYYDKDLDGHCMPGQVQFFQAMGSIALVEDVIILCLPIPVFWRLQINRRQKIALILVFSLGGLCVTPSFQMIIPFLLMIYCSVCIFSLMRLIEFRKFQLTDLAGAFLSPARTMIPTNIIQPQAPKNPSGLAWNSTSRSFVAVCRFLTHLCKASATKSEVTPQNINPNLLPDPTCIYTRCGETKAIFESLIVIVEHQRTQSVVMLRQVGRARIWRIIGRMWMDGPTISGLHDFYS